MFWTKQKEGIGEGAGQLIATQAKHVVLLKHPNLDSVYFSARALNLNAISKLFILFETDFSQCMCMKMVKKSYEMTKDRHAFDGKPLVNTSLTARKMVPNRRRRRFRCVVRTANTGNNYVSLHLHSLIYQKNGVFSR